MFIPCPSVMTRMDHKSILIVILLLINLLSANLLSTNNGEESFRLSLNHELMTHTRPDRINDTFVDRSWKLLSNKLDEFIIEKITRLQSFYDQLKRQSDNNLTVSSKCDQSIKFMFQEAKLSRGWAVKS